jgi:hypothetical protein
VREVAWKAQLRLCNRYRRLAAAGKPKVVVTTAIAREMVGFIDQVIRLQAAAVKVNSQPTRALPRWRVFLRSGRPRS